MGKKEPDHGRAQGASRYTACEETVVESWLGQSRPRKEEKALIDQ